MQFHIEENHKPTGVMHTSGPVSTDRACGKIKGCNVDVLIFHVVGHEQRKQVFIPQSD